MSPPGGMSHRCLLLSLNAPSSLAAGSSSVQAFLLPPGHLAGSLSLGAFKCGCSPRPCPALFPLTAPGVLSQWSVGGHAAQIAVFLTNLKISARLSWVTLAPCPQFDPHSWRYSQTLPRPQVKNLRLGDGWLAGSQVLPLAPEPLPRPVPLPSSLSW